MSTTLLQEAQAFQTELIEWRRTLHMSPELDMDLPVTVAFVKDKLTEMKNDPFYRLTHNVEDASEEETKELLNKISGLSDDDLTITSSKTITV